MNTNLRHNQKKSVASNHVSTVLRTATGLIALVVASFAQAQDDLPFSSGSTGVDGPLVVPSHPIYRQGASLGYDETNQELVMFGGYWSSTYFPETWTSSDPSLGWTKQDPDTFVSARRNSAMTWDYQNSQLVLFGGYRADGVILNDFWAWDGTDWTQIAVTTPPARQWHDLVSDPVGKKIYLIGGRSATNTELNDIWQWDGTAWTELTEVGTPPTLSYSYSRAVYDRADASVLVYNSNQKKTYRFKAGTWSEIGTATKPAPGWGFSMVYDPVRQSTIIVNGTSDTGTTWEFKNNEWGVVTTTKTPSDRYDNAYAYDTANAEIVVVNGYMDYFTNTVSNIPDYDTWSFKNSDWTRESGRVYNFDMSTRESGIWNFTTIDIPENIEVRVIKNISNTPLVWLAQGAVNIDGILRVDGQDATQNNGSDAYAVGGPGGSPGGLGAIMYNVSGNYAGTPGQGAGGGEPGVTSGQNAANGKFRNTYGNTLLLPLVGGSGGGGGASNAGSYGGHGGGGGGAVMIASSLDITINGHINADGGAYDYGGASYGGRGSGGAIKLMADRVQGSGVLWARGGRALTDDSGGRIRIEAFFRPLTAKATPAATATAPIAAPDFGDLPTLAVVSVDGENVAAPPSGNLQTPDVVFTAAGTISVVVDSENVPVGTPVTLRITTSGQIILLPAVDDPDVTVGVDGTATFTATVPAGLGTIQAFTEFNP